MLELTHIVGDLRIYDWKQASDVRCLIASTPEPRSICNDPLVLGTEYTN